MWGVMIRLGISSLILGLLGCAPEPNPVTQTDGGAKVTYTKDVQPILKAKCSPCHAGQDQGHHNIATNYADAHKQVESIDSVDCWGDQTTAMPTMPKTVGECSLISIKNGRMPFAMGCGQPTRPAACVGAAEQEIVAAWVAGGMPQ